MEKIYTSLGLMSGTSMDGIDASIIKSNGEDKYETVSNQYFKYDEEIYRELVDIRSAINFSGDLEVNSIILSELERKITLFHATVCKKIINDYSSDIDLIGFHGQTIFHNANEKISKQLGDANLLSGLLKKRVIYNFRENDMINGGQGAPLAPIFHQLLVNQNQIDLPACIINIGGIANITIISSKDFNDFNLNFVRGLSLEDGLSTLTDFTAFLIYQSIF